MKKRLHFVIIFLFFATTNFAQNKTIDSLKTLLIKPIHDTSKLHTLNELSWELTSVGYYDNAITIANHALALAKKLNSKKQMAVAYSRIAGIYSVQSQYPKSLEYYIKSLKIREDIKDKKGIGSCYANIGNVYYNLFQYQKTLDYYLKSLKIHKEFDDKEAISTCYTGIGLAYFGLGKTPEALKNHFAALKINQEIDNKSGLGSTYTNIGIIYYNQSENQKALEYYFKALKICKEIIDKEGVGTCYTNLGVLYCTLNNYKKAIAYSDSSIQLSKEIGFVNNERLAYQCLAEAYSKTGNYQQAYISHVKFQSLNDSIFNTENSKQLSDLKTNFEVEKKEAELKAKAEVQELINVTQKQKQRLLLILVSCILVLVAVFSVFMYRRFKITQNQKNIIELKEKETQQQNEIITIQKHLVEEKHKEITDSINYAERIQRSFLATTDLLDNNLSSLRVGTTKQYQTLGEIAALPSVTRNDESNYFVFFKPKDVVSGDFYWASTLSNNNFALATADSTGHGVPGAIMSLLNVTSLEKAIEHHTNPADILNHTRQTIIERLKKDGSAEGGKDGMDCSLLVFDFESNKLQIAAAHNPVWIIRNSVTEVLDATFIEIKPDKMPVGKHDRDQEPFTLHTIDLQKGDVIYTLTDGFPDQFGGASGKKFMSKNLRILLINNAHLPMHEQKQLLETTFKNWKGNLEQVDDLTVIGIRI